MKRTIGIVVILTAAAVAALLVSVRVDVTVDSNEARAEASAGPFWGEAPVTAPPASGPNGAPSFADLAEVLSPTVVNIQTERSRPTKGPEELFEEFFGRQRKSPHRLPEDSTGSGFVISTDGYIVTNDHVVEGASRVEVQFVDGTVLEAEIIGRDPKTDLALVKVQSDEDLAVAHLGDSDGARAGDWVMAIGSPYGLDHTVTVGVLSAKGRRRVTQSSYDDFLQTDASINPGNSGGPLFDMHGRVIGINTAIRAGANGIGFSIPINLAKEILPQLRARGSVTRGWLGVSIQEVKPALAESFGLDSTDGALVGEVFKGSPAERAGLEHGDVIVQFGEHPIRSFHDLPRRVAAEPPGADVDIVVMRGGKRVTLGAHLDEMEQEKPELAEAPEAPSSALTDWGFEAETLDPARVEALGLPVDTVGALVTRVEPDSPAGRAGMRQGDVVLEAEKAEIETLAELEAALDSSAAKLVIRVQRRRAAHYLALERR
jgi:serine protease Do